jgi:hypothetical protein
MEASHYISGGFACPLTVTVRSKGLVVVVHIVIESGNIDTDTRNRIVVEVENCCNQGRIVDTKAKLASSVTCRRKIPVSAVHNLRHVEGNRFCNISEGKCDGFEAAARRGKEYDELVIGISSSGCNWRCVVGEGAQIVD